LVVIGLLCIVWAIDHFYNYDYFSDGLLAMLRQMGHSFGW